MKKTKGSEQNVSARISEKDRKTGREVAPTTHNSIEDSTVVSLKKQATIVQQTSARLQKEERKLVGMAVDMVGYDGDKSSRNKNMPSEEAEEK